MTTHYEMRHGDYALIDHNGDLLFMTHEIAIGVSVDKDTNDVTFHKHGRPDLVHKWLEKTRSKLQEAGFEKMAMEFIVIEGLIPVDELNKMIDCSGYATRFYQRMIADHQQNKQVQKTEQLIN